MRISDWSSDVCSSVLPDYGNDVRLKPDAGAVPENYRELDNGVLAANLKGKLLIAYGDMAENAFPAVTLQLCDALNQANRSYDLQCGRAACRESVCPYVLISVVGGNVKKKKNIT